MLRITFTLAAVGISVFALACGGSPPAQEEPAEATSSASSTKPHPKIPKGMCGCYGGHMDAAACGVMGWTWDARHETCWSEVLPGDCAYAQNKHRGDGSGSDIYNLGVTCEQR